MHKHVTPNRSVNPQTLCSILASSSHRGNDSLNCILLNVDPFLLQGLCQFGKSSWLNWPFAELPSQFIPHMFNSSIGAISGDTAAGPDNTCTFKLLCWTLFLTFATWGLALSCCGIKPGPLAFKKGIMCGSTIWSIYNEQLSAFRWQPLSLLSLWRKSLPTT